MLVSSPNIMASEAQFRQEVVRAIAQLASIKLGEAASPTFGGLTVSGTTTLNSLTANRLMYTDAAKQIASVSNLANWVAGTENQITVTDDGDGTVTLSLPQNIHSGASPTFAGATFSGLTASQLIGTTAGKSLVSVPIIGNGLTLSGGNLYWAWLGLNDLSETPAEDSMMVWNGPSAAVLWESGATLRTTLGVGTGDSPTFAGLSLTNKLTIGTTHLYLGTNAGLSGLGGRANDVFVGTDAGRNCTGGAGGSVFVGYQAGYGMTAGTPNTGAVCVGLGQYALQYLTTGSYEIAIGYASLRRCTSGGSNTAIGQSSGEYLTGGISNVYIGSSAGQRNVLGNYNTFIGTNSGKGVADQSNTENVMIGYRAGYSIETGSYNCCIGRAAAYALSTGNCNTMIGYYAGRYQTTASNLLIIDGLNRANAANEITKSMIYGVMNAAPSSQTLRINAVLLGSQGAKIGDGGTSHYSQFEADGTLKFVGDATVWADLQFPVNSGKQPSSNNPTWAALTTNTGAWGFTVDDYVDLDSNEVLHSWKEGTPGKMHLHLSIPTAQNTGSDRFAKFTVYVAYVNYQGIWAETTLTQEVTIPNGSAALQTFYLAMGDVALTSMVIGTQMKCRVKRIAATGGTEYGSNVFVHQVGCHLEMDTIGSRSTSTK